MAVPILRTASQGVLVVGLLAGAWVAVLDSRVELRADAVSAWGRVANAVQSLDRIAGDQRTQIAFAGARPQSNFDALVRLNVRLSEAVSTLQAVRQGLNPVVVPFTVNQLIGVYLAEISGQRERVDRFQTAWTVVRNSRRYVPQAVLRLRARVAPGSVIDEAVLRAGMDLKRLEQRPTDVAVRAAATALSHLLDVFDRDGASLPEAEFAEFVRHAEVLIEHEQKSYWLLEEISIAGVRSSAELVIRELRTLGAHAALEVAIADRSRRLAVVVAGASLLLSALLALLSRLRAVAPAPIPASLAVAQPSASVPVSLDLADSASTWVTAVLSRDLYALESVGRLIQDTARVDPSVDLAHSGPGGASVLARLRRTAVVGRRMEVVGMQWRDVLTGTGPASGRELTPVFELLHRHIGIDLDVVGDLDAPIALGHVPLAMVVCEACSNAAHALRLASIDDPKITIQITTDDRSVEFAVVDTAGVPPSGLSDEALWRPFRSGWLPRLGLGLAMVQEIVTGAGGTARFDSPQPALTPVSGTSVPATLPHAQTRLVFDVPHHKPPA